MNNRAKLIKKQLVDVKKIQDWINTLVSMMSDEVKQRFSTGEGIIHLPHDVYEILLKDGIIENVGGKNMGIFFDGIHGKTFVIISYLKIKAERVKVKVNDQRRKDISARYANKIRLSDIKDFDLMPDKIKEQLNGIPYNTIVRTLCVSDRMEGKDIANMAVKYGVPYKTIYQWFNPR